MKKNVLVGLLVILLTFGFISCDNGDDSETSFIAVSDIINVPITMALGSTLTLNGAVEPSNATNHSITWTIKNAFDTGAVINGNHLSVTGLGTEWGLVIATATIFNGIDANTSFSKDFELWISRYNTETKTLYLTYHGADDWGYMWMTENNLFLKDFYDGQIKENTSYTINIKGTLNTDLNYLFLELTGFISGSNFTFSNNGFYNHNISEGEVDLIYEIHTITDFQSNSDDSIAAKLTSYYSWDSDPDMKMGIVKAIISNFSMKIDEIE